MLGLMLQLESFRQRLRKRILPMIGSNDYHLVGTVLALILSSGTLITGFTIAPVSLPGIEFSFLTFVTGIIAILSVILWPVGLVLLQSEQVSLLTKQIIYYKFETPIRTQSKLLILQQPQYGQLILLPLPEFSDKGSLAVVLWGRAKLLCMKQSARASKWLSSFFNACGRDPSSTVSLAPSSFVCYLLINVKATVNSHRKSITLLQAGPASTNIAHANGAGTPFYGRTAKF